MTNDIHSYVSIVVALKGAFWFFNQVGSQLLLATSLCKGGIGFKLLSVGLHGFGIMNSSDVLVEAVAAPVYKSFRLKSLLLQLLKRLTEAEPAKGQCQV